MEFNILDLTPRLHHSMTVPTEGSPWRAVGHFSVEVSGPVGSLQGQVAHLQALWTLRLRQLHPLWLGGQIQGLTGFLNTQRQQISRGGAMCTHTFWLSRGQGCASIPVMQRGLASPCTSATP